MSIGVELFKMQGYTKNLEAVTISLYLLILFPFAKLLSIQKSEVLLMSLSNVQR